MDSGNYFTGFDGAKIYFDSEHGTSDATMVFVHGFGGDLTAWRAERDYFHALGFSTIALDLRGHGLSDRRPDASFYRLENFSQDIDALIRSTGLHKVILIGHCFGGMVSMLYSSLHPDSVSSLILIDTGYKLPFIGSHPLAREFVAYVLAQLSRVANYHVPGHVDFRRFIGTQDIDMKRLFSDIVHTSLKSYLLAFSTMTRYDLEDCLKKIQAPTLIISGTKDTFFPPAVAKKLSDRILNSELDLINGANHIIVFNNPEDVNTSIRTFLRKTGFPEI
jgi:3-oxoadipate enol-lactonase